MKSLLDFIEQLTIVRGISLLLLVLAFDWSARRRLLREKRSWGDPTGAERRGGSPLARGKRSLARKSNAVFNVE